MKRLNLSSNNMNYQYITSNVNIPLKKDSNHSWSVADFENNRDLLTKFLKSRVIPLIDSDECRRILIRAPVKSGKREMVEYLSMRDHSHNPHRLHVFISAFHRVADEDQRRELQIHNMVIFSLTSKNHANQCIEWIKKMILSGKQVVPHIDECDFGTGQRQILAKIYKEFRDNNQVTFILYSATPQEVLFSGEVEEEEYNEFISDIESTGIYLEYNPPESFCGPKRFLENNLVIEASPFFIKKDNGLELSEQGKNIVNDIKKSIESNTGRNILILRLSYSDLGKSKTNRKENKAIYQLLQGWQTIPELQDFLIVVDKSEENLAFISGISREKINWSDKNYWRSKAKDIPMIFVIDQTSSRSTEWACHDRVLAYHDFRNTIIFSTISQAQERVNHYETKYGSFQKIQVYGHLKSFQLSAGTILYSDYLHHDWESKKINGEDLYQIRSRDAAHIPHPNYPKPLSKVDSDKALQDLGCFVDIKMSSRVRGNIRDKKVFNALFFPCTKENFEDIKEQYLKIFDHNFKNPFIEAEKEKNKGNYGDKWPGYLRDWKVFDFDRDIKNSAGWGSTNDSRLTVCYKDSQLGVAVRYDTGETESVNTLSTHKSMYKK